MSNIHDNQFVVFYDGVCGLCNGFVRFLLKIDRKHAFHYAALQGKAASLLRQRKSLPVEATTIVFVENYDGSEERIFYRSRAVFRILKHVGGIWTVLSWLAVVPRFVSDAVYNFVARRRYGWFGKYDACPLPPADVRRFFLE